ncbi:PIG-L family deacetylase [Rhodococcus sp. D2-41]|uniref:PIG-L family deacetylase n=1 Tax=Speluncibacter jeojiensis TaxID=2710754 RepID=A0A9X4RCI8_9ACTN|nr:PIG-L deacetylase family protein [Rhodococcus sp. D2-41]MDG3010906.1 PIG-L family deacetylase [Rhodococcus sp. D2-41]MDG3013880.1 PIG-L family deacetylase [Corynebacteriales bacterium D3-21]
MEPMVEDWQRVLVIVAHPDDAEYGMAAAVAKWTDAGKDVAYVLATRGEAGIAGLAPHLSGPLRAEEQRRSAAAVGVQTVEFLDFPDGRLQEGLDLRRALAGAIRRHRPELVVTLNHRDSWARGRLNSADHRALGRSVFDAVADAANEWIFPELAVAELAPWSGVRAVAVVSPQATHGVDVTGYVDRAVASLAEHRRYLEALSDEPVEQQARDQVAWATAPKPGIGDGPAVGFELFEFA